MCVYLLKLTCFYNWWCCFLYHTMLTCRYMCRAYLRRAVYLKACRHTAIKRHNLIEETWDHNIETLDKQFNPSQTEIGHYRLLLASHATEHSQDELRDLYNDIVNACTMSKQCHNTTLFPLFPPQSVIKRVLIRKHVWLRVRKCNGKANILNILLRT